MNASQIMLALVRYEICGTGDAQSIKNEITADILPELYRVSKQHDIANIIAYSLEKMGLLSGGGEIEAKLQKQQILAVYRYERLRYELEQISDALEEAKIKHVLLKGSVLRDYYPEPWLRTSCDIDILVSPEELEKAIDTLVSKLNYKRGDMGEHDVSLFSESGVHLELHFDMVESKHFPMLVEVLSLAWDYTQVVDGYEYRCVLNDEMTYYYHIAHIAKHLMTSGCGARLFLDQWILLNKVPHDKEKRRALLERGNLADFEARAEKLTRFWFDGEECDLLTEQLADYILKAGIYGTYQNRIAVERGKRGGKLSYAMSRIFVPYKRLKDFYPSLEGRPILTPAYQVRRWCRIIFKGGLKNAAQEVENVKAVSDERAEATAKLLKSIGL